MGPIYIFFVEAEAGYVNLSFICLLEPLVIKDAFGTVTLNNNYLVLKIMFIFYTLLMYKMIVSKLMKLNFNF
jgi:hypothetical protein